MHLEVTDAECYFFLMTRMYQIFILTVVFSLGVVTTTDAVGFRSTKEPEEKTVPYVAPLVPSTVVPGAEVVTPAPQPMIDLNKIRDDKVQELAKLPVKAGQVVSIISALGPHEITKVEYMRDIWRVNAYNYTTYENMLYEISPSTGEILKQFARRR